MSKQRQPSATTPASVTTGPAKIAPAPTLPRQTKAALLRARLAEPAGVSLADLMAATGWQAHTVRAALTGLRKAGLILTRRRENDQTIYAIETAGSASGPDAEASAGAAEPDVQPATSEPVAPAGTAAC